MRAPAPVTVENYGSYQLLKRLAVGGMAQIYLARERGPEGFEKHLVVKRILPHLAENSDFVHMFLDEARIAARLNHPNIVQIFRLGAEGDSYFIAMEYIHGEDVRRVWKRAEAAGKSMPVALVCRVIMDACSGLDYAHKLPDQSGKPLGIVHRDISPQNILVTFEGGVKVVDFGIAKAADQATVTKSGVLKGKYSYMSPEQASGQKLDCRSDIFALGVVLHELLTGQRLFKRQNDIQTLHAVTECQVPLPSQVNPRLPRDLDPVVMKALAREPKDRYTDAIALQMALEDWLLQHQMPSSSAHLAAFMQELYAERLAEERKAGQLLVEELDAARALEDEAANGPSGPTPQSRSRKSPPSESRELHRRGGGPRTEPSMAAVTQGGDSESTTADRLTSQSSPSGRARGPVFEGLIASAREAELRRTGAHLISSLPQQGGPDGGQTLSLDSAAVDDLEPSVETTHTTDMSGRSRRIKRRFPLLAVVIGASAALALAGGTFLLARRGAAQPREGGAGQGATPDPVATAPLAPVRATLASSPAGATVIVDGQTQAGPTPVILALAPGRHTLVLRKSGYREIPVPVEVPAGAPGQEPFTLPTVVLEPESAPEQDAGAAAGGAPTARVAGIDEEGAVGAAAVHVTFRSEPQATLTVDGQARGRTPQTLTLAPNAQVAVRLERAGYQPVSDQIRVGASDREQVFVLEKLSSRPRPARAEKGMGKMRFAVTPWANVTCGTFELGQTPLPDVDLPVGTYECRFTNPDSGTRTERVEVKANAVSKVSIKF